MQFHIDQHHCLYLWALSMSPRARQQQGGFTLAQLVVVVAIASMVMSYATKLYADRTTMQIRDDRAKFVGETLSMIGDATKTYITTFFQPIQLGQDVTRNGYTVPGARVLAPTLTDLNGLGFLRPEAVNPIAYGTQSVGFNVQLTVNTAGCTIPSCTIEMLATTTVPLLDPANLTRIDVKRASIAAQSASPGNAGVAMPAIVGGNPAIFVATNGTSIGANPSGIEGIVGLRNGYDSQGFFEFLRRDGTLPMTGDLNMDSHSITNGLNATFTGTLTAGEDIHAGKTIRAEGRLSTGEFVQMDGIATEGQSCTPNGLLGKNATGLILSCQAGKWKKVGTNNVVAQSQYTAPTGSPMYAWCNWIGYTETASWNGSSWIAAVAGQTCQGNVVIIYP